MAKTRRQNMMKTTGCYPHNLKRNGQIISLIDLGGAENVRDIWPYYFVDVRRRLLLLPSHKI